VRRIAEPYGVSYDAFLLKALDHTGEEHAISATRPLASSPDYQSTQGISIERLLDLTSQRAMAGMVPRARELIFGCDPAMTPLRDADRYHVRIANFVRSIRRIA
jgi:hypothetical protein